MDRDEDASSIRVETPSVGSRWDCFGYKFPRQEVVYFSQTVIIYVVIFTCLINLSFGIGEDSTLWTALLGSCLGYIMPHPSISKEERKEHGSLLRHPA